MTEVTAETFTFSGVPHLEAEGSHLGQTWAGLNEAHVSVQSPGVERQSGVGGAVVLSGGISDDKSSHVGAV